MGVKEPEIEVHGRWEIHNIPQTCLFKLKLIGTNSNVLPVELQESFTSIKEAKKKIDWFEKYIAPLHRQTRKNRRIKIEKTRIKY